MNMRRVPWSSVVLLILAAGIAYLFRAPLAMALGARVVAQRMAADGDFLSLPAGSADIGFTRRF